MKLLCAGIVAHQVMQCLYVYIPFFIAANGHYFILGQTYVVLGRVKTVTDCPLYRLIPSKEPNHNAPVSS